jgi:hypothetical protein
MSYRFSLGAMLLTHQAWLCSAQWRYRTLQQTLFLADERCLDYA